MNSILATFMTRASLETKLYEGKKLGIRIDLWAEMYTAKGNGGYKYIG